MRLPLCVMCFCLMILCSFSAMPLSAATPLVYDDIDELMREGRAGEAKAALEKKLAAHPGDVVALAMFGDWYRQHGDRQRALTMLERARAADVSYPLTYYYLGKVYFLQQRPADALAAVRSFRETIMRRLAADASLKRPAIVLLHDMGEICFALKEYEEFRAIVDTILTLDPRDQGALYNRGVYCYVAEHNRSRAYQYFMQSAGVDADPYLTKKARYAIEFMRTNPDSRVVADFSFLERE